MNDKQTAVKANHLSGILAQHKKTFWYLGWFSLIINLLMLVPSIYMLQIYDRVMMSRSNETLLMLTLIVVWMFIIMGLLEYVRSGLMIRLSSRLDIALNQPLYRTMFSQAIAKPGQGSAQAMNDLTTVRQFLTGNGLFAFFDAPWIPIYIAILFLFHPAFGWFAVMAAVVLVVIAMINERSTKKLLQEAASESLKANQLLSMQLKNAEVVHSMGMLRFLQQRWLTGHMGFLTKQSDASDRAAIWSNLSKSLRLMFQSLILGLGAYLAVQNEITAGMLIAGSIILGRALAPIDQMIATWKQLGGVRVAYHRIDDILNETAHQTSPMSLPKPKGELQLEQLCIHPQQIDKPILDGINLSLNAGQTLALIGPSGSGKTTLARAIMGVVPITEGSIRIDQAELQQFDPEFLGLFMGYLPQDVALFDGSIADNIARFMPEPNAESIIQAAQIAGVHDMILHMPEGYNTLIGAGGISLSGGQRQRIGLARAVFNLPKIIVLDEPNAHLDDEGEKALIKAILYLKQQGSTVIFITHKLTLLNLSDQIMLLVEGKARAYGTRDEVIKLMQSKATVEKNA